MSTKEIDNANATRGNMYTIYTKQMHTKKYIEHVSNKPNNNKHKRKTSMQIHKITMWSQ